MNISVKRKAVSAQVLPAAGNMVGFTVQTVAKGFIAFARRGGVGSVDHLSDSYLRFAHGPGEFKLLGSWADGYSPLEQRTLLEVNMKHMHDGSGTDSTTLYRPPKDDEAFSFMTNMFLSQFYNLISSAGFYSEKLECSEAFGMYCAEEGAVLLVNGLLPDSVAEMLRVTSSRNYHPVEIELEETGMPVSSGSSPLQRDANASTILSKFEGHLAYYEKDDTKSVTGGKKKLERKNKKRKGSLAEEAMKFNVRSLLQPGCH